MTTDSLDTYLGRLRNSLRTPKGLNTRIVDEAREHLVDAVEGALQRGLSREAAEREALERFGDPGLIGAEFQRVYRWDYAFWYLVKVAVSVLVSAAAALALQVIINLRVAIQSEALRLAPDFLPAALVSVAVVVGLAAAWEIGRRPFDARRAGVAALTYVLLCLGAQWLFAFGWRAFGPATLLVLVGYLCAQFDHRPVRLAVLFLAFTALLYAGHSSLREAFGAVRALTASAALLAVWTSTLAILARADHAFLDTFNPPERG